MNRPKHLLALVFLALAGTCAAAPKSFKDAVRDMDAMFTKAAKAKVFSGSVLIAKDGQVFLSKGYGQADLEKNLQCTPLTKFRIASMTKQFTAMAILLLESRGRLQVQDRISSYIKPCPPSWQDITIHQLLTHTSGIPDLPRLPDTVEQTIALLRDKPLDFTPGSKWQYSNGGYMLLGAIVERAANASYEAFLRDNIFVPLKMTNTGYDHQDQELATNYVNFGSKADISGLSRSFSAGALYSTVEDLYRWDQALSTERLLPSSFLAKMFTAHVSTSDASDVHVSYGYGWMLESTFGRPSQYHEGGVEGVSTIIAQYPQDRLTIIILSNQSGRVAFYAAAMEKAFFGPQ